MEINYRHIYKPGKVVTKKAAICKMPNTVLSSYHWIIMRSHSSYIRGDQHAIARSCLHWCEGPHLPTCTSRRLYWIRGGSGWGGEMDRSGSEDSRFGRSHTHHILFPLV